MASLLCSIRVQTMENCGRFVFYNNIYYFFLPKTKTKKKKTARRGYSHRPQLLTNQRARIRSVIVKSTMEHNLKMMKTLYSKHIRELQKKSKATHMNGKQPFEHWFCPNTIEPHNGLFDLKTVSPTRLLSLNHSHP